MANSEAYIPNGAPFHVEPDGFRVWQSGERFICASPTAVTYRGDLAGVARFIERERGRLSRV